MITVSNTSPINYLILIGQVNLLEILFGQIILPKAVVEELQSDDAPILIKGWINNLPAWVEIQEAKDTDESLNCLDRGEREAIALAINLKAGLVLIDEADGRQAARDKGLKVTGTLGILVKAKERGLVNIEDAIEDLKQTNFRISIKLLNKIIASSEEKHEN